MADRYYDDDRYRDDYERAGRRYRSEGYYGGYPGEREYRRGGEQRGEWGRGGRDDRGFFERAGDEVRSWFGDEEAERRRRRDEREYGREYGRDYGGGWGRGRFGEDRRWGGYGGPEEEVDRDWARQWGYVEGGRGPRGGWGQPERGGGQRWWGAPEPERSGRESGGGGRESGYGRQGGYGREGGGEGDWGRQARSGERDYGERQGLGGSWSGGSAAIIRGPHTGRGPRGYQRSDDRIKEELCERLSEHGEVDAGDMEVRVSNAEITLQGSVRSRYEKRIAEDIAESISGVREVHNQLRLGPTSGSQESGPPGEGEQPWEGEPRGRAA